MAKKYGFKYELVQYKWPRWLYQQTEKQRIIWGYKILFLDVLFPLAVDKIIFVDADQVRKKVMVYKYVRNSFWLKSIQFHSLWSFYSNVGLLRLLQLYEQNQWCCRTWNAVFSLVFSHVEIKSLTTLSCPKLPVERERCLDLVCATLERFGLWTDCERTSPLWKESEVVGLDHLNNF